MMTNGLTKRNDIIIGIIIEWLLWDIIEILLLTIDIIIIDIIIIEWLLLLLVVKLLLLMNDEDNINESHEILWRPDQWKKAMMKMTNGNDQTMDNVWKLLMTED